MNCSRAFATTLCRTELTTVVVVAGLVSLFCLAGACGGPPASDFSLEVEAEPTSGEAPLTVTFSATPKLQGERLRESDSDVSYIEYEWTRGAGDQIGSGREIECEFTESGQKIVRADVFVSRVDNDPNGARNYEGTESVEIQVDSAE